MSHPDFPTVGLRSFFERFQALSTESDVAALAALYAPQIMFAGPGGTQVVASADLLRAIPKRRQLLESAGHRETALVGFEESPLTDRYSLVRAEFRWRFQPAGGEVRDVTLPSAFVVDHGGDAPQIVVYMNSRDIGAALQKLP